MGEFYPVTEPTETELEILEHGDGIYLLYVLSKLQFFVEQVRAGITEDNATELKSKLEKLVKDHLGASMAQFNEYYLANYNVELDLGIGTPTSPDP